MEINYLTLVPTNESKEKRKKMKSCGVKLEIELGQQLKTQMIRTKNK